MTIQLILININLFVFRKVLPWNMGEFQGDYFERSAECFHYIHLYARFCRMDGFVGQIHQPDNQHKHFAQNSPALIHHVSKPHTHTPGLFYILQ